jgi:putative membrane protein
MMTGWGMTPDGWIWMGIWVLALLAMVWLLVGGSHTAAPREDAMQILSVRFARGEINQEEYERARRLLVADKETQP